MKEEIVVIGGGIAGAAAAIKLASLGKQVLLLEKESAAHPKVCGEFLSYETQHYLNKLGIDLHALESVPIDYFRLSQGKKIVSLKLPFRGLSLSRQWLDEALLVRAAQLGVKVRRGIRVTDLTQHQDGWHIMLAGSPSLFTDTVFLATGKHELRNWPRQSRWQHDFIGFKMHFILTPEQQNELTNHVEMMLFDGGYVGLELVEPHIANLCLMTPKAHFSASGKSWTLFLEHLTHQLPLLKKRLYGAVPCFPHALAVYPIPYGFLHQDITDAPKKLFRLGDQMAVIPSFSGSGMAIALHTASLAVESYMYSDAATYHRNARNSLLSPMRWAVGSQKCMKNPLMQSLLLSAFRMTPGLIKILINRTRIAEF